MKRFTLVEVVVALGLLVMIAVLSAGVLQSAQTLWEGMKRSGVTLESRQNIDRIADSCFKNMIPFHWPDGGIAERQIFRGDPESVLFAYLHDKGIRFVELRQEDGQLIARYRETPILYWNEDGLTEREIIAGGIESLRFEYFDRDDSEIVCFPDWDEETSKNIPLAILMTIRFTDGSEEQWLRRSAGNSWETTLGRRLK